MHDINQHDFTAWQTRLAAIASSHAGDDGAHDICHLHRVWHNASTLLETTPQADALVVLAACYLHDVVNLPKNHSEREQASRRAALLATAALREAGFPEEKLTAVAHAIEAHSYSAGIAPDTIEAKIVQDADRLDALGAVGLARMFYIAGRMGSALAHPSDPLAQQRDADDRTYALDHINCKLEKLPASMQTAAGRTLAQARLAWLHGFRDVFVAEWSGRPG
jgi:uncharacterized protein